MVRQAQFETEITRDEWDLGPLQCNMLSVLFKEEKAVQARKAWADAMDRHAYAEALTAYQSLVVRDGVVSQTMCSLLFE